MLAYVIAQVFVGEYLIYTLDDKLVYDINLRDVSQNSLNLSTIIPANLVPLLVVIIALAVLIVGIFYFNVIRTKRATTFEIIGEGGERYMYIIQVTLIDNIYSKTNSVAMSSLLQPSNLQIMRKHYNIISLCMATIRPQYINKIIFIAYLSSFSA